MKEYLNPFQATDVVSRFKTLAFVEWVCLVFEKISERIVLLNLTTITGY